MVKHGTMNGVAFVIQNVLFAAQPLRQVRGLMLRNFSYETVLFDWTRFWAYEV